MSLSIFDVDGINFKNINEGKIKVFSRRCGYDMLKPNFEVEVGEFSKELYDNDAVVYFNLNNILKGVDWEITEDKNNNKLELLFRGWENYGAFLQALEFAVNVLREARSKMLRETRTDATPQKEERAF